MQKLEDENGIEEMGVKKTLSELFIPNVSM